MAVREALAPTDDLYLQRIQVASNYKVVVTEIKEGSVANYGAIIQEIIHHSSSFVVCNFVHEYGSSNVEAHNLAKHALTLGAGCHVWLGQPGNLYFVCINVMMS